MNNTQEDLNLLNEDSKKLIDDLFDISKMLKEKKETINPKVLYEALNCIKNICGTMCVIEAIRPLQDNKEG